MESSREPTSPRATRRPRVPPAYGRIGASAMDPRALVPSASPRGPVRRAQGGREDWPRAQPRHAPPRAADASLARMHSAQLAACAPR
jgi:hypothetical protein